MTEYAYTAPYGGILMGVSNHRLTPEAVTVKDRILHTAQRDYEYRRSTYGLMPQMARLPGPPEAGRNIHYNLQDLETRHPHMMDTLIYY